MKRFHVHIAVDNLAQNIGFYSALFGSAPTVEKPDYAKWMLDDPRINFAISARGGPSGVNHLGFQVDSAPALEVLRRQVDQADLAARSDANAACCYANSNKYWLQDPQGIAWETFHTLGDIPVFGAPAALPEVASAAASACCPPPAAAASACLPKPKGGCC